MPSLLVSVSGRQPMDSLEANNTAAATLTSPAASPVQDSPSSNSFRSPPVLTSPQSGKRNDTGTNVDGASSLCPQAQQSLEQGSSFDLKPTKNGEDKGTCTEWLHNEFPHQVPDSDHSQLASNEQQCSDSGVQGMYKHESRYNFSNEMLPDPLCCVQAYDNIDDNMVQHVEASEDQNGMTRPCLQFREQRPTITRNYTTSSNIATQVTNSRPLCTTSGTENLSSLITSRNKQLGNSSQHVTTMRPDHSLFTVPKIPATGLPLNSTANASQMDCGGTESMKLEADVLCMQGSNLGSVTNYHHLETMKCWSTEVDKISASPGGGTLYGRPCFVQGSKTSESFHNMELIEQHSTPHAKTDVNSENVEGCEEFNQQSTKKKRQKSSNTISDQDCKRCNCKRTKCLKLYCACFAVGIFCEGNCACKWCMNRPEYEDTVLGSRQQVESRNPLAFAPKIISSVQNISLSSFVFLAWKLYHCISTPQEDGNKMKQSSGRHKEGCNCKKSMCQKKYCECYQAKVGCSSACRCDGCKNVFGRKEDYGVTEEMGSNRATEDTRAVSLEQKLGTGSLDLHHLTPMPPSFYYLDHAKDVPKSGPLSRRCLVSPPSGITVPSSYVKRLRSLKNADGNGLFQETGKQILGHSSFSRQMDYNNADTLTDIHDHSPLPSHPSIFMAFSASSTGFSSHGRPYDILEDEMPDILKDTTNPIAPVKVSSSMASEFPPSPSHALH
ncbi:hypothetical protein SLEP1_g49528 [Rubroshorea leprosula]|uniref:CRC domain-containing protein n=1 Tax=Rubroshorea leprosula TaxID=152421 RepID=A0AAV5LX47_9ROSI|nr:hypothetical protein SLEP1_g49528 [Rubroshorea leprosula]